jgi:hypothetical protein
LNEPAATGAVAGVIAFVIVERGGAGDGLYRKKLMIIKLSTKPVTAMLTGFM